MAKPSKQFEQNFACYMGAKWSVLTSSATAALHIALLLAGVKKGDEVITTPLSYVSTSNASLYCGAKPIFIEVEPETGLMDMKNLQKAVTPRTKAILPVHLYGQMADMRGLKKIAGKFKIAVVEDAAHAIESERDGLRPGRGGLAACFSFHVAKNITSGEGGAIVTNSRKIMEGACLLRRDGIKNIGSKRQMTALGFKYLTTDFQAALLDSQLKIINKQSKARKELWQYYADGVKDVRGVSFPQYASNSKHAYHMFIIWVGRSKRDRIGKALASAGIQTSIHYDPIHLEPYYRKTFGYKPGNFPIAEKLGFSTITLPLHLKLTRKQQAYVIKSVVKSIP